MQQIRSYVDDRLGAFCYSCSGAPTTRDHVPAKVFLDEPYPTNLPVVGCCQECNEGPSLDEQYVACLLEVAACGPNGTVERPKVSRILSEQPGLEQRLAQAVTADGCLKVEQDRLERVIAKMGRGLWSYETGETTGALQATVNFAPVGTLSAHELDDFFSVPTPEILPEVGSRLMFKVVGSMGAGRVPNPWQVVQPERFAYAIDMTIGGVKIVLRDFLAAQVGLTRLDEASGSRDDPR